MEGGENRLLPAGALPLFQEGIGLVLSRWSALQLAVENEWGGRDSRRKVELLCSDILTWFTQNKGNFGPFHLGNLLPSFVHCSSFCSFSGPVVLFIASN